VKREPHWLSRAFLLATHDLLLAEHGGARGVRDGAALESVLAAPRNLAAYGEADLFDLAAAYAQSCVRLHPFMDGNKRVALVAAGVFLAWNGRTLQASETDAVAAILALVTRRMDQAEFAGWLRASCARPATAAGAKPRRGPAPPARVRKAKRRRRP
jgi:death-on-curing protein